MTDLKYYCFWTSTLLVGVFFSLRVIKLLTQIKKLLMAIGQFLAATKVKVEVKSDESK